MSDLTQRIYQAFPDEHVLCTNHHMLRRHPRDARKEDLAKIADHMAALANTSTGGVLLVGLTTGGRWQTSGITDVREWRRTLGSLARALRPSPTIEIQPCDDRGHDVLAVRVRPIGATRRVIRPGAHPMTVRQSKVVEWFPSTTCSVITPFGSSMRSALEGTSLLDIDPKAADIIGFPHPIAWSIAHRHRAAEWGIIADDGVTLTRLGGVMLAGAGRTRRVVVQVRGRGGTSHRLDAPLLLLRDALDDTLQPVAGNAAPACAGLILYVTTMVAHTPQARVYVEAHGDSLVVHTAAIPRRSVELEKLLGRFAGWSVEGLPRALSSSGVTLQRRRAARGVRFELALRTAAATSHTLSTSTQACSPQARSSSKASTVKRPSTRLPVDRQAELLKCLSTGVSSTRRELQEELGWSRSTLRNALEAAVTRGAVVREAASPRSPNQSYRVA